MRIRDKKNQTYDRFRYLLEFQVKSGQVKEAEEPALDDETSNDVFGELGGVLDGNKKPEEQGSEEPQMQEPIENKTDVDVDITDNEGFEDTASDLLKIHSSKIDNLTQYINDSVKILKVLNQKTDEITSNVDQMNGKVGELAQRVDKLTPATPLESLNQMITNTTGAQSIEDYWNEYFAKHGRTDLVNGSLYYGDKQFNQNEKGMSSGVYKTPEISDNQIKDIIKNT
jgi:outer membrane murein-binding lipoprotein Lpp